MARKRKPPVKKKGKRPLAQKKSDLRIRTTDRFWKDFDNSSPPIQRSIISALEKLKRHKAFSPGMKVGKFTDVIWYLRASDKARITFKYEPNNLIILLRCGDHTLVDKKWKRGV